MRRRYEQVDEYAAGNEDYEYDKRVQEIMDDETEARAEEEQRNADKRAASGMSPELLNLKPRKAA